MGPAGLVQAELYPHQHNPDPDSPGSAAATPGQLGRQAGPKLPGLR